MDENGRTASVEEKKHQPEGASYTYWVREATGDAAPLPLPKKLDPSDVLSTQSQPPALGSVWNRVSHSILYLILFYAYCMIFCSLAVISYAGWNLGGEEP